MKLFQITKSELRKKLISYFFSNPEKEHYLREIASLLNLDPGNLSKELNGLEKDGIFVSQIRGRIKLYKLNKKYLLFNELKNIIFKTIGIEGTLRSSLEKISGIQVALIYGSFASGEETMNSDIDIFIIGKPDEKVLNKEISIIERKTGREINYIFWPAKEVVKKLKEKNSFLEEIFKNKKIFLKGTKNELQELYRAGKIKTNKT